MSDQDQTQNTQQSTTVAAPAVETAQPGGIGHGNGLGAPVMRKKIQRRAIGRGSSGGSGGDFSSDFGEGIGAADAPAEADGGETPGAVTQGPSGAPRGRKAATKGPLVPQVKKANSKKGDKGPPATTGGAHGGGAGEASGPESTGQSRAEMEGIGDGTTPATGAPPAGGATAPTTGGAPAGGATAPAPIPAGEGTMSDGLINPWGKITHATQDHAPGGASDARTTVGVGEWIKFTAEGYDAITAGKWTASDAAPGMTKAHTGDTFDLFVPYTPATVTVVFDPSGGPGNKETISITVIKPERTEYRNAAAVSFPASAHIGKGKSGVIMQTDVFFAASQDVSFANLEWLEVPGPASAASGYMAGKQLPYHHPNKNWLQVGDGNLGVNDTAGFWGFAKPWSAGSFEWAIPNKYRVLGETAGHDCCTIHQICTIAADGTMTVTKAPGTMSRTP